MLLPPCSSPHLALFNVVSRSFCPILPQVNSYVEFRDEVLPRIRKLGYNAIQIMAIQVCVCVCARARGVRLLCGPTYAVFVRRLHGHVARLFRGPAHACTVCWFRGPAHA